MNKELIANLKALKNDPSMILTLYELLFNGNFWVLVADRTASLENLLFLNYPSSAGMRELPIFTSSECALLSELQTEANAAKLRLKGANLWPKLLDVDIMRTGECVVAVDPSESYGIRMTREMILGMVVTYGSDPMSDQKS